MSAEQTLQGFEQGENKIGKHVCLWVDGNGMEYTHWRWSSGPGDGHHGRDKYVGGEYGERGALEDGRLRAWAKRVGFAGVRMVLFSSILSPGPTLCLSLSLALLGAHWTSQSPEEPDKGYPTRSQVETSPRKSAESSC